MFFYETSLEISMSIAIGVKYISMYDNSTLLEETESNTLTRKVHRVLIYAFFGMLVISYVAIIAIMTRKAKILKRIQPLVGAVYEGLDIEGHWFARFYPIWFMTKRIGFIFVVNYFTNTSGLILILMHIYLAELLGIVHTLPFLLSYHTKLEVFNGVTAYLFLTIIQVFNQQHPQDFSEEDKTVEVTELQETESDLFISPMRKQ